MGFKPVEVKRHGSLYSPLEDGQCSIAKTGWARFRREDLDLVDIADEAALLADCGSLRVALRRPRLPEDAGCIVRVSTLRRADRPIRGRVVVNLAPGIRKLGLTVKAVTGRWSLTTKDDLLIVGFTQGAPSGEVK